MDIATILNIFFAIGGPLAAVYFFRQAKAAKAQTKRVTQVATDSITHAVNQADIDHRVEEALKAVEKAKEEKIAEESKKDAKIRETLKSDYAEGIKQLNERAKELTR